MNRTIPPTGMTGWREWWIHFPFSKVFLLEETVFDLIFLLITEWFTIDTFSETTFWITLVCSMFCWDWFVYWWYIAKLLYHDHWPTDVGKFSDGTCFSVFVLFSHGASIKLFLLFFPTGFFVINSISLPFEPLNFCHLLANFDETFPQVLLTLPPKTLTWMKKRRRRKKLEWQMQSFLRYHQTK